MKTHSDVPNGISRTTLNVLQYQFPNGSSFQRVNRMHLFEFVDFLHKICDAVILSDERGKKVWNMWAVLLRAKALFSIVLESQLQNAESIGSDFSRLSANRRSAWPIG
jgi:hypothetical protein